MSTTRRCTGRLAVVAVITAGIVGGTAQAGTVDAVLAAAVPGGISIPAAEWIDVTDQPSGIIVKLPGKAAPQDVSGPFGGKNVNGRYYTVKTGDNSVSVIVLDTPGNQIDLDRALRSAWATGTVTSKKTTINGRPALDGRITITRDGINSVDLVRFIATDTHVVQLQTAGPVTNEKALMQLHQQLIAGVRIP